MDANDTLSELRRAEALSQRLGLPLVDPEDEWVDPVLAPLLPRAFAEGRQVLPLHRTADGHVVVAMANPEDPALLQELGFALHAPVRPVLALPSAIRRAVTRNYELAPIARELLREMRPTDTPTRGSSALDLDPNALSARLARGGGIKPYVELFNTLLIQAVERRASDIHIEPFPEQLRIRLRIDGLLRDLMTLPEWAHRPLVSRVKAVAEMDISDSRRPQDGKASATLGRQRLDLRVSTMPGHYGEKVVIRLLDGRMVRTDLARLGWHTESLRAFYHMVSQPQGLVLVVGPTGSGKSTTLYSTIVRLNTEHTAVVTVEDPVEYVIPGITQVQVNNRAGVTFASAIRGVLRQDPNVLVIGEVRDAETADTVIQAANTGHLVLSTLHTTSAVTAVTRLLDLQVPAYLLGATLTGIVSQRLVRRVCGHCSVPGAPVPEDFQRLGLPVLDLGPRVRQVGAGCPACQHSGYSGRVGVFELVAVSERLRERISQERHEGELWAQARADGMITLIEDGLRQVAEGATTLEELARVVTVDPWLRKAGQRLRVPGTAIAVALGQAELPPAPTPVLAVAVEFEEEDEAPPAPAPEATAPAEARPVVLVVDDAFEILLMVEMALERDYKVITARDGVEALEVVERRHPDLIVLDVMMPRMSGYDVCRALREDPDTALIPILMLSARGEKANIKQGLTAGADDYLPKPFDPEELLLRVKALLRRSGRLAPAG